MSTPDTSAPGPLRWNLSRAADEFGVHRDTLRKVLLAGGHQPDADGFYTTRQIHQALTGDREAHKARKEKAEADRIELDNAERKRLLVPVEDALKLARKFTFAVVGIIRSDDTLGTETKNAVLGKIRGLASVDFSELPEVET